MPMTGGEKLDAHLAKILRNVGKGDVLRVGFLEGATYPDGTPVALVAAVQNFGSATVPPRPFFTNMIVEHTDEWGPEMGSLLVASDYDANRTLGLMGQLIDGELKQSILDTNEPPLAPATIKRKGFAKPLVDTGHMLNSTGYEVVTT